MATIEPDRLMSDLRKLAEFGKYGAGVDRIAFSEPDLAARRWLRDRMEVAGLDAGIDRFGTVLGQAPGVSRAVLIGSHSDSVPRGGWLDGALGVVFGLEIARALRAEGLGNVDVVSFQDEEGSYIPCLGSKAFLGELDEAELAAIEGPEGLPLDRAVARLALAPDAFRMDGGRVTAFFEAHIEQGPRLEAAKVPIGVVTGIVGIRRFRVTTQGEANHAGTTPMEMRRDAGRALIRFAAALPGLIAGNGSPDTVWNIGVMGFSPGAANVVPAEASMIVEMRDLDAATLDRLEQALLAAIRAEDGLSGVAMTATPAGRVHPVAMDAGLQSLIARAAQQRGIAFSPMPSGAGHDAMVMARALPSAMLFVPSIGGRSHDTTENTNEEDIVLGCQVLADAVAAHLRSVI
ncbi:hydantoinase/carbamoylase family amidase [Bosea sp. (in: a-proteobacteria)]|uniref:hydantoinase/carbamoylase family amidase n=1 Tax=Bosea sp. (in: a-proteobacteria) TaxID=1871050 RepID=UPI00262E926B|nr:hydantoinase/carbamoylase family amidase [Bosea sp. (in: a-proteobacteria)]MCO5092147.1 hydantoinase/carbamoylase family amidase [Bosea sp. (in: a-proteobacteria)]